MICSAALCSASVRAFTTAGRGVSLSRPSPFGVVSSAVSRSTVRYMSSQSASSLQDTIKSDIASSQVVIYSKSYCPFCTATKNTFADLGVDATVFELDELDNGADIQSTLMEMTGQRTVPNVFVNGEWVGGNDNTQAALRSGKLQKMLG